MPKDIENSSLQSKSEDSVDNNNVIDIKNRRKLSVNIVNWTLLLIATCIITFVITNKYYSINNNNVINNNVKQLDSRRRILKESNEMRKPLEPTLSPTEEPTIVLTHSPDFLSSAPTPTFSHAPNFLSAAPSPSYTHAPDYPKTMPPSQEGRKLAGRPIITTPTEEPTEFAPAVYKTRNPTALDTRNPTAVDTHNPTKYTHRPTKTTRKLNSGAGPFDRTTKEPTMDPTERSRTTKEPTMDPTEMVHKTRSPNHYRTSPPTEQPSPSPPTNWPLLFQDNTVEEDNSQTIKKHKKRNLKDSKGVPPGEHTATPTEEPTVFAPAVFKTDQPTLTRSPNSLYTESPNVHYTSQPTPSYTHHPTEETVRLLKKDGFPERVTAEPTMDPTEMVYKTRSPNFYKTKAPTEQPSPSPPTNWPLLFQDTTTETESS